MKRLAVLSVCAVVWLSASPARALNLNEWVPGLTLTPFFSERVEYQSNVFQTSTNPQGDVIFKSIHGLVAELERGPLSLSAGYRAEILNFVKFTNQDTAQQFAALQATYERTRLKLSLRDDFASTSDPPGTELTGRIKSTTNTLAPAAEYRLTDRFTAGLSYTWIHVDFQQSAELLDRDEYLIGVGVGWYIAPRTQLRLDYAYGWKTFSDVAGRDVTRNVVTLGPRGDLTSKLSSGLWVGVEVREPDSSQQPSYVGPVAGGNLTYRITDRTTLALTVDRSVQESAFEDAAYYVTTNASLLLQHQLTRKLSGYARLGGGFNNYPTKQVDGAVSKFRQDEFVGAGGGAQYDVQPWLRVGTDYQYTRRSSNFSTFGFDGHTVSGRMTLQF